MKKPKKPKAKNTTPFEDQEQMAFVIYLERLKLQEKIKRFTAIPNSTYTDSWNQKRKNKDMGVRSGLLDLFIITENRSMIFIEMKRQKGGVVSKEQKEWIKAINECDNAQAFVCKGFKDAKTIIDKFTN